MRKFVSAALILALLLGGCGMGDDPYRVDTVVRIPVDPTEAPKSEQETAAPETEAPTEAPTEAQEIEETAAETKPPKQQSTGGNKKPSTQKDDQPKKETQPPETLPSETEPPATEAGSGLYDISGYALGALAYGICDEISVLRAENDAADLELSSRLSAIASCRAYELSLVWSHDRPDGRGYATVLGDYGYSADAATELLIYVMGAGDAAAIVEKWTDSDSHRAELLGSYDALGIGIHRAGENTYVCVLLVK